ncbi:glycosyltransferase family 4 protein [Bosea massiliensis]|uniref:Glycosyltransferase family 4 protein n=1 Tax=Bosea massiliensis TaxID=151419 RepID=A0ABW0P6R9_9HYPH
MSDMNQGVDALEISKIIAPEIKFDEFYQIIESLAASENLTHVLEIGSSAGGGSTEAFVRGLSRNPHHPNLYCIEISKPRFKVLKETYADKVFVHCYNRSTVTVEDFPPPEAISAFYEAEDSGLKKFPLELVQSWRLQDIQYVRDAGVEAGAIEQIKLDHGVDKFDMVLIDGSEFTGTVEYEKVRGARLILLDDTHTFKCWDVRRQLLADPAYEIIADNQMLRNGFSAFRRRPLGKVPCESLPIHFFTIVLNGEPFIRYHEHVFSELPFGWHWHIVEGVADLKHDTAWSIAGGGKISASIHDNGRSNDGTSAYLDDLARRFPENVTIYRKPPGVFWDGKKEMVNAPLPNIDQACLLWQVDNDELWTLEQIKTVHRMFADNPDRHAARYWCWYYVGPDKIISTRYNYAQNPEQEWLRTWRFVPGAIWDAHEPPILVRTEGEGAEARKLDIAGQNPFTHDEMERAGVVFHHFAYATPAQLSFKEQYYGYKGATEMWRNLNEQTGPVLLKHYFAWVSDNTMVDSPAFYGVEPLARPDAATGAWHFDGRGVVNPKAGKNARIVVDGIFWQYLSSGIGRVWENMLSEWVKSGYIDNVVVLDRAGTAPRLPGVHYWSIARHDYAHTARDSQYLEQVCRQLGADLFVSTYYSSPLETPSFFSGYDMIPEMLKYPMDDETWEEKRRSILHASAHSMISSNSAKDLEHLYPEIARGSTHVVYVGAADVFAPPAEETIEAFKMAHDLVGKPYVVMVGERLGYHGHKNGLLAVKALAQIPAAQRPILVCVGGHEMIEPALLQAGAGVEFRRMKLSDADLVACYGGAHAVLYPSLYEGFGMPPLEGMACGTPAIVCRNSSLPEVVGEAGIYVDENDPSDMARTILSLYDSGVRADLIQKGKAQAASFSFHRMAEEMAKALDETIVKLDRREVPRPGPAWKELRAMQRAMQEQGLSIASARVDTSADGANSRAGAMHVAHSQALQNALSEMAAMRNSPFWKLRDVIVAALRKAGLRNR